MENSDQIKEAKQKFRLTLRHLRDLRSRRDTLKEQVEEAKKAFEARNATLLGEYADAKRQDELAEMQLRTAAIRYYKLTEDKRIEDGLSIALLNDVELVKDGAELVGKLIELKRGDLLAPDTKAIKSFVGDLAKGATVVATDAEGNFSFEVFDKTIKNYLESLQLNDLFKVTKKPSVRIALAKLD